MATKIKMLGATAVGALIEKSFKAADDAGQVVHEAAIQCLLHLQEHGDAGFIERLVDGLEKRSMNMRGLRLWAGVFTPATARAGKWSLLDKDGDAYARYLIHATEKYSHEYPPEEGVGKRMFFLEAADANPYWTLEKVQEDNGKNITMLTTASLMGQVIGLDKRVNKAITDGKFGGDAKLADAFVEHMRDAAETFRKEHKAELRIEAADVATKKLSTGDKTDTDTAGLKEDLGALGDEAPAEVVADVGGEVAAGIEGDEPKQVVNG